MKQYMLFLVLGLLALLGLTWGQATAVSSDTQPSEIIAAAANGSITGTVTDGVNPLSNILVEANILNPDTGLSFIVVASTYTNSNGFYEFTTLEDNSYAIKFTDESGNYVSEYYDDNRSSAFNPNLQIAGGNTLSDIDAVLAVSSHITGRVTDAADGNPLAGIPVSADDFSIGESASTLTDSGGYYTLSNILPGSYIVSFNSVYGLRFYTPQYYDSVSDYSSATPVVVGTGATAANIDASLTEGGYITGRVTAEDGTTPLESITVRISENYGYGWLPGYDVTTDANGDYYFNGLVAGNYRLAFSDETGIYASEMYDNVTGGSINDATDIPVLLGQTTANINASLAMNPLPPLAVPDVVTTTLNAPPISIDVLANDSDPNGDPLTIFTVSGAANGFVTIDGTNILYSPVISFVGTDSFTYGISDGQGGSAYAQVTVTVKNEQPVDVNPGQAQTVLIDTSDYDLTIDIPANALPSQTNKLVYRGLDAPTAPLPSTPANIHFTLTLLDAADQEIPNPTFTTPLSVTIQYDPALLPAGINEADIQVYFFNTSTQAWESIPIISRNLEANSLVVELTHFTEFALADSVRVYLPVIIR